MKKIIATLIAMTAALNIMAACEVVDGGTKTPFDGKAIGSLSVEKKSLSELNKQFPDLKVIENSFKGEVVTCSVCSGKYISCSN